MDQPQNSVKFGTWGQCKRVTTGIYGPGWKMPSPQAQCHCAPWLSRRALNLGGVMGHENQDLKGGALVLWGPVLVLDCSSSLREPETSPVLLLTS